jgi:hypothetical protein
MAILIANIGKSDISVKIGDHYFPIGFDRNEPNLQQPEPNSLEADLWKNRITHIREMAQSKLGINVSEKNTGIPPFREFTRALLTAYQKDSQTWHPHIRISRIWGVIETARSSNPLRKVYLFVTDQPEAEKQGYPSDTVHAFEIIKHWIQLEFPEWNNSQNSPIILEQQTIPQSFSAIAEDKLFDYYYKFFQNLDRSEPLFISVRGGTPQMQTALRTQAIAADFKTQIFLEPKLEVVRILQGDPSECDRIAYWRYQQTQKYQAVSKLLGRWDFDGAVTLLQDWQTTLQSLQEANITDDNQLLQQRRSQVEQVLQGLRAAVDCFNLDHISAQKQLSSASDLPFRSLLENYDLSKALYAQCQIYRELRQVAHFLSRLGSFHEVTQLQLICNLGGDQYLDPNKMDNPAVLLEKVEQGNSALWQAIPKAYKSKKHKPPLRMPLGNRYAKQSYINALVVAFSISNPQTKSLWQKLDFWYGVRNKITHGSKGVSVERVQKIYNDRYSEASENNGLSKEELEQACSYDEIPCVMADILSLINSTRQTDQTALIMDEYYIYSIIRDWATTQLQQES